MPRKVDPEIAAHLAELDAEFDARFPELARAARPARKRFDLITLGTNDTGERVRFDEVHRLAHTYLVGTTGTGKSTLMLQLMQQDIARGRGLVLIDPHGSDPTSPFARLQSWIEAMGFHKTGRVITIDPNLRDHVVGFNPLAPLPDTDPSVIADALIQAFQRAWGDEDINAKPNIRSVLTAMFIALSEKGLTIPDAKLLYDREDRHGIRQHLIDTLADEFARDELERLHQLATDRASRGDFNAQVVGPINRLNLFVGAPAIRTMLGQTEETLDLREAMDSGKIVLVNLNPGGGLSEEKAKLLGAVLLRYLFLLAKQRRSREPYFLYIDECHDVLSGDVARLLAEARKFRVGVHLANQFLWQLEEASELILHAVLKTTRTKVVFAMEDPEEAQRMGEMVIPLDLETPIKASIRPTAIGQQRVPMASGSKTRSDAETTGRSITNSEAIAIGHTRMRGSSHGLVESEAEGFVEAVADAISQGSSTGAGAGMAESTSLSFTSDPSTPGLVQLPTSQVDATGSTLAANTFTGVSSAKTLSDSRARSTTKGRATVTMESEGEAISQSITRGLAVSDSAAHTTGTSETDGWSEGFETVFALLPNGFHSIENMRYFAGEQIRQLPVGKAFVYALGKSARITIADPAKKPYG